MTPRLPTLPTYASNRHLAPESAAPESAAPGSPESTAPALPDPRAPVPRSPLEWLMHLALLLVLGVVALALPTRPVAAEIFRPYEVSPPMLNFTLGEVGLADEVRQPERYGIEYRFAGKTKWQLVPAIGVSATESGASYAYTDVRLDLWLSNRWLMIPSFGLGWFQESDELPLGHDLQFRSGLEIAYRFENDFRVGVALFHLSNGGISDQNPGTESLVFSLCVPLRRGP